MMQIRRKLLTCKSLAHSLAPLVDPGTEVAVMDIALHVNPQRLKSQIMEKIAGLEEAGVHILLGYGLYGRALGNTPPSRFSILEARAPVRLQAAAPMSVRTTWPSSGLTPNSGC